MAVATDVDRQAQAATRRLRRDIASARSTTELSSAFRVWITSSQRLTARGDALAQQLNLPVRHRGGIVLRAQRTRLTFRLWPGQDGRAGGAVEIDHTLSAAVGPHG